MKKITLLALVIVAAGGGYTAASWYFGKQTESIVSAQYAKVLETTPYLKMVERDYQRGLFTSKESVVLELLKQPAGAPVAAKDGQVSTDNEPLRLTVHTRIQHGPFPGLSTFAAATADSQVLLPESIEPDVAELLDGKSPFSQHTTIFLDGSGFASFSSPEIKLKLPTPDGDGVKSLTMAWQGLDGEMRFSSDMKQSHVTAHAPELHLISDNEVDIRLSDIRLEGDNTQIFDDISLFTGTQRMSIGELSISVAENGEKPVVMKQLAYDIDLPHNDGFIDMVERLSIDSVEFGQEVFGPIHFDYSFKHLHARAVAEISQALTGLYADPALQTGDGKAFAEKLMPVVMEKGDTLLGNSPEFHIDRISLANSRGEINLNGRANLGEVKVEQIVANPLMLMTKLDASGELSLQEEMVLELLRNPPGKAEMGLTDSAAKELEARSRMMVAQFQQQVAMLSAQGYLTREGGLLKTNAVFKGGQLLINGKPFPPRAAPAAMDEAPSVQ